MLSGKKTRAERGKQAQRKATLAIRRVGERESQQDQRQCVEWREQSESDVEGAEERTWYMKAPQRFRLRGCTLWRWHDQPFSRLGLKTANAGRDG